MSDDADVTVAEGEITELVDQNGLVKLFANRVRARVLATLFYAHEPLDDGTIAEAAGISQTATIEALEALEPFGFVEAVERDDAEKPLYRLDPDDELTAELRSLAELATERFYPEE
jgi:DNA-binding transcriptional regulator GbsR (MarR family)